MCATPYPDAPTRQAIQYRHQIPTCDHFVWTLPPDPETGRGGAGHTCGGRATHRIRIDRYSGGRGSRVFGVCRAHIGQELDAAHADAAYPGWPGYTPPAAPVLTVLDLTLDRRAWAHGRRRYWLTERPDDGAPITLELFASAPHLEEPGPHRPRPAPVPRAEVQPPLTLFGEGAQQ
ncbi:hypothetical protein [Nocardia sp. NPDC050435]|uniref:hypothetical protein n=1 Tax=Nocardia sp. NPDC050435 TaxID=3155040 RepID=UPI003406016F